MVDVARVKMFGMNVGTFKWSEIAKNCGVPQEMIDARFPYMLLDI